MTCQQLLARLESNEIIDEHSNPAKRTMHEDKETLKVERQKCYKNWDEMLKCIMGFCLLVHKIFEFSHLSTCYDLHYFPMSYFVRDKTQYFHVNNELLIKKVNLKIN